MQVSYSPSERHQFYLSVDLPVHLARAGVAAAIVAVDVVVPVAARLLTAGRRVLLPVAAA